MGKSVRIWEKLLDYSGTVAANALHNGKEQIAKHQNYAPLALREKSAKMEAHQLAKLANANVNARKNTKEHTVKS